MATTEKMTYEQALEAVKLYQSRMHTLQPIDDPGYVWEKCVEDAVKPPEPEYQWGDPVEYDGAYRFYCWEGDAPGTVIIATEHEGLILVNLSEIKPAPYRIRLRPDDGVDPKQLIAIYDPELGRIHCEGMSADVDIIR